MRSRIISMLVILGLVLSACVPISAPDSPPVADTGEEMSAPAAPANLYMHPDGLFTAPIPAGWTVDEEDDFGVLTAPDGQLTVYLTVREETDLAAAFDTAWERLAPDAEMNIVQVQSPPPTDGLDEMLVHVYETDVPGELFYAIGQLHDGRAYLTLLVGNLDALQRRGSQFNVIQSGFTIAALERITLVGVEPLAFSDTMARELEAYIEESMELFDVPGLSIAIVQNGEIVYSQGFGIRDPETQAPVTPDTLMMIGSTTKPFTTMLMAALIDEGLMSWDTPVVDILPDFAVADPELTPQITIKNLVCNCTGVSRRDLELIFNAQDLSAEDVIESLAEFEFFTDFGEAFQYSNQMIATGGYAAAAAGGGEYGDLYEAYADALRARILEPMGMVRSTLSTEEAVASGNHAVPFGLDLSFTYAPIPLGQEEFVTPIAPAGGLWSSSAEMGRYLITLLNLGVSPDGERVVSEENLLATWQPQVPVSADIGYGLGWFVGEYKGQPILYHGGATMGFMSELAFMPAADLGISVLTNARATSLNEAVRYRILEMVFEQAFEADVQYQFALESFQEYYAGEMARTVELEPEWVEEYLGAYFNEALGSAELEITEGVLILDVGEFRTELHPQVDDAGEVTNYVTFNAPALTGMPVSLEQDEEGIPVLIFGTGVATYVFERLE